MEYNNNFLFKLSQKIREKIQNKYYVDCKNMEFMHNILEIGSIERLDMDITPIINPKKRAEYVFSVIISTLITEKRNEITIGDIEMTLSSYEKTYEKINPFEFFGNGEGGIITVTQNNENKIISSLVEIGIKIITKGVKKIKGEIL